MPCHAMPCSAAYWTQPASRLRARERTRWLILAGGGALLYNLDRLLSIETRCASISRRRSVELWRPGAGRALEHLAIVRDSLTPA